MFSLIKQKDGKVGLSFPTYKSPLMLYLRLKEAQIVYCNISVSHGLHFSSIVQGHFCHWSKTVLRDGEILSTEPCKKKFAFFTPPPCSIWGTYLQYLLEISSCLPVFQICGKFLFLFFCFHIIIIIIIL